MDGSRFDDFARILAARRSRRGFLGAALSFLVASAGTEAVYKRPAGVICRSNGDCESGICGAKDATGRQRCQCATPAHCPVPSNKCLAASCQAGTCQTVAAVTCRAVSPCHIAGECDPITGACSNPPKPNGSTCTDGDACSVSDTCQDGVCQPGSPRLCPLCQACSTGACRPTASDIRCSGNCVDGACIPACLPVQTVCDATAPTCCQDQPTECSYEANCTTEQGQARCCRPFGAVCSARCDCCSNADCVNGICALGSSQQCVDSSECAGDCCSGLCRDVDGDIFNCGACGVVCPAGPTGTVPTCVAGTCGVACTGGRSLCGEACVRTSIDAANCGGCGISCAAGQKCCSGNCIDVLADPANCGTCGAQCLDEETCCNGFCVHTQFDKFNCGQCGNGCPNAQFEYVACCDGACTDICTGDVNNCGECGRTCPLNHECTGCNCYLRT